MIVRFVLLFCCLSVMAIISSSIQAATFKVGFYNHPPFMSRDSQTGIYHDIFDSIARETGYTFEIEYYPSSRLRVNFENNLIDIEPGINPIWRQDSKVPGHYTIAFARTVDVVLFRPGQLIPVHGPESLEGKTVGAIRGYFYPGFMDSFDSNKIIRADLTDEPQLLNFLVAGRVNQIFINKAVAQYWLLKNDSYRNYIIGDVIGDVEVMMRVHPSKIKELKQLNKALKKLSTSGEIDKIYKTYQ